MISSTFLLIVLIVCSCSFPTALGVPTTPKRLGRRQSRSSPGDLSWIKKWAAVGDSYAAGIGAGSRIDYSCSRYDHSYPSVINANGRLSGDQSFEFKACSVCVLDITTKINGTIIFTNTQGAKSSDVVGQVNSLSGNQNAITISSGGNDIGLVALLNECIYTWNPRYGCASTVADSKAKIKDELPKNLDRLYSTVKGKLASGGTAYVTAYARFFDETTNDCDKVSWHWYSWPFGVLNYQYLTVQRRKEMNELVDMVNGEIKLAIERAGSQFILVEYDSHFGRLQGRYCQPGVQEPSPNRAELLMYLDGTTEGSTGKKKRQTEEQPSTFPPHTFEGDIHSLIQSGSQNFTSETPNPNPPSFISISAPDSWARVFHPLQNGHSVIAGKVLYHMTLTGSKLANQSPSSPAGKEITVISGDTCPHLSRSLPLPRDKQATCGAELSLNFPREFQLLDKKAAVAEMLFRMRDQACQGLCEKVAGVPNKLLAAQRQGENGCEYAVKISARKEAYFYATGSGQNCYDATERMIDSCMTADKGDGKGVHEAGWINGPNYGEFFQVGVRDLNGEGSHHSPLTTVDSEHLGHLHVACRREDELVAHGYRVDLSNWDDGNWGKSIQREVKECKLAMTGWQYEPGAALTFADGTQADHWASFSLPLSNGGCAESKIEKALGLGAGGLDCPFGRSKELDVFK